MKCLVTGCAGFIGSTLTERLLKMGHEVIGVDCFSPYYAPALKKKNLENARKNKKFRLVIADLAKADLGRMTDGVSYVFHEAAQPGVLASWGTNFSAYVKDNVLATQRLLEAVKDKKIKRFIYASSSSVYGDSPIPMKESGVLRPFSPYGVTKLAAENLVSLYHRNFGLPTVTLRYFTVFGPRQRPDMGFTKFIKAILADNPIFIYGDGKQSRDVTFVDDAVQANILAMKGGRTGEVYNVGGGNHTTVNRVISLLEDIVGRKARLKRMALQKGDVRDTLASPGKSRKDLGFIPQVRLEPGLRRQVDWVRRTQKN